METIQFRVFFRIAITTILRHTYVVQTKDMGIAWYCRIAETGILIIMLKYHEISQHCKTFCRGESLGPHSMLRESVGWELKCCRKIGGSLVPQVWTALLRLFLGKKNLGYLWNWNFMDIYGIDDHRCVFQDVKLMSISWATS